MAGAKVDDGPLVTQAYVVSEQGGKLELKDITLPPLKPTQVEIDMTHCGLCHTDIHMRDNDWGISNYPMVPGHEGVGVIRKLGSCVRSAKVGDIVGICWIRDSCQDCDACAVGRDNLCRKGYQGTYLGSNAGTWGKDPYNEHGGCFSKVMRVEEKFAFILPKGMNPELACPLMCGGGTVFEPIVDYVKPGKKVGVVGIGGLGTTAIKLAKLYGAEVTAISRTATKEAGARKAGAAHFVVTTDADAKSKLAASFNVIIDTTPVNGDVSPYMDMLAFDGSYIRVGIPAAKDQGFSYNWIPLIFTQRKIQGSIVLGSARTRDMLELAHANQKFMEDDDESWTTTTMPFDQVNEGMEELLAGKNKGWRMLLKW
mmetsp:Transcript_40399/g.72550  ORF Transcript_40399/g.72550 Transcript_40399/m.72550 type:complete len:369 (-) Transcript_40399:163-1269(-)|eukprot:CAMPEP_0177771922 /NCGR_PEP_ID=MMETSP0491_2-20121128/11905_1 /TAXON_ID=63592 /ORGANISM="Tetraselmis chuii, Strain PLY429" /LENGTH=368 /DNA_ID=CAMNT_0019289613 /DNA_START=217 /DNA_END=1323 /DNA_ORIENTATION=-